MLITIWLMVLGTVYSITDDFLDTAELLTGGLIIGFESEIWDDIIYQLVIATGADTFLDDEGDESEDLTTSAGLVSFLGFAGGLCGDLGGNLTESFVVVSTPAVAVGLFGCQGIANSSYNNAAKPALWFPLIILEIVTAGLRGLAMGLRIVANSMAGHLLINLTTLTMLLLAEYSAYWYFHIGTLFLLALVGIIECLELLMSLTQNYVWGILANHYSTLT